MSWCGVKPPPPGILKLIFSLNKTASSSRSAATMETSRPSRTSDPNPACSPANRSMRDSTRRPGSTRLSSKYTISRPIEGGRADSSSIHAPCAAACSDVKSRGTIRKPSRSKDRRVSAARANVVMSGATTRCRPTRLRCLRRRRGRDGRVASTLCLRAGE